MFMKIVFVKVMLAIIMFVKVMFVTITKIMFVTYMFFLMFQECFACVCLPGDPAGYTLQQQG